MDHFQMIPMMMPFPQQQPLREEKDEPPLRVQVAIAVLNQISHKEMARSSGGDVPQVIDGVDLLPVERETQAAACNLLTDYFKGKVKADRKASRTVRLMACPVCYPKRVIQDNCPVCSGMGSLTILQG